MSDKTKKIIDAKPIKDLAKILDDLNLTEISYTDGGFSVSVSKATVSNTNNVMSSHAEVKEIENEDADYKNKKALPFIIPAGVELIKIDYETGQISNKIKDVKTIYEAFGKNDSLSNLKETLVGSEGFQFIEIEDNEENEFLIY